MHPANNGKLFQRKSRVCSVGSTNVVFTFNVSEEVIKSSSYQPIQHKSSGIFDFFCHVIPMGFPKTFVKLNLLKYISYNSVASNGYEAH